MFTRTVVTRLAGEEIGRDRIHLLDHRSGVTPSNFEFIAEALLRLKMRGLSREDLDRVEFEVVDA